MLGIQIPHHMLNDVKVFISLILTGLGKSAEMVEKKQECQNKHPPYSSGRQGVFGAQVLLILVIFGAFASALASSLILTKYSFCGLFD